MERQTPVHRHLCSELVSLSCIGKGGRPRAVSGNLEEIGEWSALILTETPIARRAKVRVTCEAHQLKGFVLSCKHEGPLGFLVEVRLYPESRWSEQWFTPQHLLALWGALQPKLFHAGAA